MSETIEAADAPAGSLARIIVTDDPESGWQQFLDGRALMRLRQALPGLEWLDVSIIGSEVGGQGRLADACCLCAGCHHRGGC